MNAAVLKFLLYTLLAGALAHAKPLTVYWVDVEGGAATLLVTPEGESILIDAGDALDRDAIRISDVARHAGLIQIDHVILTHWHPDHFGGVGGLSQRIPLRQFYDHGILPTLTENAEQYQRLMATYKKVTGGKSHTLTAGDVIPLRKSVGGQVVLQCVAGSKKVISAKVPGNPDCHGMIPAAADPTDNARSLAFKLIYGRFTMFDGGDLTRDIEQKLACPGNLVGQVVLYQTDGHGMDVSNDATFIHSLRPRVVVVNNGPKKGGEPQSMRAVFSSPGLETVWEVHRNLKDHDVHNTDPKFIANEKQDCTARYIKAVVEPAGGFTIQIEPSGTRQEYRY